LPGNKGNGPVNSDGFYVVFGYLFSDNTPIVPPPEVQDRPGDPLHWGVTWIKYTQWGPDKVKVSTFSGPNSVVKWQIQAGGDLYVNASKDDGGELCAVPPPTPF
jgi:hypothetical protein